MLRRALTLLCTMAALSAHARQAFVYFGTYTKANSEGIYLAAMDLETGEIGDPTLAGQAANPSFLAFSPDKSRLYCVSEAAGMTWAKRPSGAVGAFRVDATTGKLTLLNAVPSGGAGPCHVAIDPNGKVVLVSNYGGGTVTSLPVLDDGRLGLPESVFHHSETAPAGPTKPRQDQAHTHSTNVSPNGHFAYVADLGVDRLLTYRIDPATAQLSPAEPPATVIAPGSGPRHLAFHPDGHHAYLLNELTSTVTVLDHNATTGAMTATQTIDALPRPATAGDTAAEVVVHPNGRFVYTSNRGHESLARFRVDPATGQLTALGHTPSGGRGPRNFAIDPSGRWLLCAHQYTDNVVVFAIDPDTGDLTPTGRQLALSMPVCVRFVERK